MSFIIKYFAYQFFAHDLNKFFQKFTKNNSINPYIACQPSFGGNCCYSGKKKRHTLKTQVIIGSSKGSQQKKILCTFFGVGRTHDFKLFKKSSIKFHHKTQTLADSGYQGLQKLHSETQLAKKKTKKKKLTKEEKKHNKELSSQRVVVENMIGFIKRFKIVADRYRNRRKRFSLRFNLIAAICNFELSLRF